MSGGALAGRVVLVTGGGRGIGRGIVDACLAAGATVVVGTLEGADAFAADEPVDCHELDVTDPAAIAAWVDAAARRHGRLDGLVANAGITRHPPFLDAGLDEIERLWRVNQRGVFLSAQAFARRRIASDMRDDMRDDTGDDRTDGAAGSGASIVMVASNHARASDAGYEMYAATKGAIVAMSRAMAWSLGRHGIRVNALSPGLTATEAVTAAARDARTEATFRAWHASGRYNTVREVGDCAVFLLSDASAALSGSDLLADQGMAARLVELP